MAGDEAAVVEGDDEAAEAAIGVVAAADGAAGADGADGADGAAAETAGADTVAAPLASKIGRAHV